MFTEERHKYILDLLNENGKILVKDLSKKFNVSESMIRKDLKVLERKNLLRRTYGGAISINDSGVKIKSFSNRIIENIDLKEKVAQKAFEQISENDTIFLDSSTTSFMIAKLIVQNNMHLNIITNMFEISSLISTDLITKFIFIGGDYNSYVGGTIGSSSIEQIKNYRCNKAFIGCTSIDARDGTISTSLSEDAATKKAIVSISDKLFLVMLNEKFEKTGAFKFSNLLDFYGIITEELPDDSIITLLKEYYINIL